MPQSGKEKVMYIITVSPKNPISVSSGLLQSEPYTCRQVSIDRARKIWKAMQAASFQVKIQVENQKTYAVIAEFVSGE